MVAKCLKCISKTHSLLNCKHFKELKQDENKIKLLTLQFQIKYDLLVPQNL